VLLHAAELSASDLLSDIAYSIADIADTSGCPRATALAVAFYYGLIVAAPDATTAFADKIGYVVRMISSSVHRHHAPVPCSALAESCSIS
jgi:hypothetical protein